MKRIKKPKQKPKRQLTGPQIVEQTNYLNLAIFLLTLKTEYGFGKKRLANVLESYLALMQEVADKRCTVKQATRNAKQLSGIDPEAFLKDVMENNYEGWKAKLDELRGE